MEKEIWRCDLKSPCVKLCESENEKNRCGINYKKRCRMSELKLSERLSKIQKELKCEKTRTNKFGGYTYRTLEDIQEAVKNKLDGLSIFLNDDVIIISDRIYIKATASITDGTSTISVNAVAREPLTQKGMSDSQVTVATSSYARKTALNGLLLLDDTAEGHEVDNQDNTTTTMIQTINKLIKVKKVDTVEFLKYFKVNAVSELTYDAQQKAIQMLEKK